MSFLAKCFAGGRCEVCSRYCIPGFRLLTPPAGSSGPRGEVMTSTYDFDNVDPDDLVHGTRGGL